MNWSQVYNPFGNAIVSTIVAALPIVVLLGSLAFFHVKAHWAAILGLIVALAVSDFRLRHAGGDGRQGGAATGRCSGCCRSAGSCSTSSSCTS